VPPAVGGIAAALDEPGLLQLVQESDELALVVAERVGDRPLRRELPLVEDGQDRVVVRVDPGLVVRGERALLRRHPELLEQEQGRGDELLRKLRNRPGGDVGHRQEV
jgi:hypothetical protein